MQTTQNINQTLAKVLHSYMETNNIRKDTDVLDAFLTDYAKSLETPKEETPELNPRNEDLISDKHLEALNLKKLG